jgi:tetratricopeptide (TPR) repeat protein
MLGGLMAGLRWWRWPSLGWSMMQTMVVRILLVAFLCFDLASVVRAKVIDDLERKAEQAQREANYKEAVLRWNEVLKANPRHLRALSGRAFCWLELNEPRRAEQDCNQAIGFWMGRDKRIQPGAILYDKAYAAVYALRAEAKADMGQFNEAVRDYNMAVWLQPRSAEYYARRGLCFVVLARWSEAKWDAEKALEFQPDNFRALCIRGAVYMQGKEWEKALADANRAADLNPREASALMLQASIHEKTGHPDKAIADYNKAIELHPDWGRLYGGRGYEFMLMKQYARGEQDLQKALTLDPLCGVALNELAWIRATCREAKFRNGKEAIQLAGRACRLSHFANWNWLDTLAAAFAEAGDFEEAIKCEKQAMAVESFPADHKKSAQEHLKAYERHRPWREVAKY